ncbi:MAG: hypothetical protein ABF649_19245 [Bacillus sp. (in: firmicutes)]
MNDKKYLIFMPPFIFIGLFLLYYLPPNKTPYIFLIPIIFWIVYYKKFNK